MPAIPAATNRCDTCAYYRLGTMHVLKNGVQVSTFKAMACKFYGRVVSPNDYCRRWTARKPV